MLIKKEYINKLKKYGFTYDINNDEYFLSIIEDEMKIIIPKKNREILMYISENIITSIPDVIFQMFQDDIIEIKSDYFESFQPLETKKEKPVKILEEINNVVVKKTLYLKTFEYKNHQFYLMGNIKIGYEIGDILTGCLIDIKINHIKELTQIQNKLDNFLSNILLNSTIYSEKIQFFNKCKKI